MASKIWQQATPSAKLSTEGYSACTMEFTHCKSSCLPKFIQMLLFKRLQSSDSMAFPHYCSKAALIAIITQMLCYTNQLYLQLFAFDEMFAGSPYFIIFFNVLSIYAFFKANQVSFRRGIKAEEDLSYCRECRKQIIGRDHHCIFIGQCVDRYNFRYYLSYTFYSYTLSMLLLLRVLTEWRVFAQIFHFNLFNYLLYFAVISGLFFAILTGGLFAGSIRRVVQGIMKVDEIKKRKKQKYSSRELAWKCMSPWGISSLWTEFQINWKQFFGEEFRISRILLPFI